MIKRLFSRILISLVLCFFLFATNAFAGDAILEWDPPETSTEVVGYMIHYGTSPGSYTNVIDVGNVTSYTVSGLIEGQAYYFSVTAYDTAHLESEYADEIALLADAAVSGNTAETAGVGGGNCFIATAAFGSYLEPHVKVLRNFRDSCLLTNTLGKAFVKFYYRHSPPIADVIREHASLRYATRLALFPLIYGFEYPYLALVFLLVPAGIVWGCKRRRTQLS